MRAASPGLLHGLLAPTASSPSGLLAEAEAPPRPRLPAPLACCLAPRPRCRLVRYAVPRPWYPALSTPPLLGTPQVKTQLSLLKGSWNKALAGWVFPAGEP